VNTLGATNDELSERKQRRPAVIRPAFGSRS
jgi:hypothetical protein